MLWGRSLDWTLDVGPRRPHESRLWAHSPLCFLLLTYVIQETFFT